MRLRWAGLAAIAMALASCADITSGRAVEQPPSPLAIARLVLQQSDFPDGWRPRIAITSQTDPDNSAQLAACAGVKTHDDQLVYRAISPRFADGDYTVTSTASSFKTESEVRSRVDVLLGANANRCLMSTVRASLQRQSPRDNTIDDIAVGVVKGAATTNVVATTHVVITLSALGQTAQLYSDTAFISGRLFTAEVVFTGIGRTVPADIQRRLTAVVARRAART